MPARYAAEPPATRLVVPLDAMTALYHRPSGATHLLASPLPELLDALAEGPADAATLLARLARRFDIADADPAALAARLDELVAIGLAQRR
ncbi:HPr-rel-A system PqqD family peptide chaperone [Sphingomonas morindae]|uniref:HPr-rel-A system PqqD family peptide chaperone n=1 Tax=Sphingomonas morindae TaxID=1541170 RepID=A0ABY4XB20_9SPHN|nr:HPr-rel-A system PqqD family peptide chaperone [Sphingomonas morindae]USI74108.1 HPr-rel-A system PqqD family peptide chaperone [Sphingomonas morindae]